MKQPLKKTTLCHADIADRKSSHTWRKKCSKTNFGGSKKDFNSTTVSQIWFIETVHGRIKQRKRVNITNIYPMLS